MPDDAPVRPLRDDRQPPFCFQTHAALDAIRAHFVGAKRATAVSVYVALTEAANRTGGAAARDGFEAARSELAEAAGVSRDTVDRYAAELVKIGLLTIERRMSGKAQLPNVWVLHEIGAGAPPGRTGAATPAASVRLSARASDSGDRKEVEKETPGEGPLVRSAITVAWQECAPPLIEHRQEFFTSSKAHSAIRLAVKVYPPADVARAIRNYAEVLSSPHHYWSHRWTLIEFLNRGLDRFVDEANPIENFRTAARGGVAPTDDKFAGIDDV